MLCAGSLIPIFLVYEATWNPATNLAMIATAHGFPLRTYDLWSLLDMIGGLIALFAAGRTWWGTALFATFFTETVEHCLHFRWHINSAATNNRVLLHLFIAQCALFLTIGGAGLVEYIGHCAARLGGGSRRALFFRRAVAPAKAVGRD